jgi:purine-binding chemotaxis protein CheW
MTASSNRFLVFCLQNENYAIPLLSVREVIAMPEVTPVPQSPAHFVGIMNLHGQIISILDLRQKFGLKPQFNPETSVIILDLDGSSLGVVVDSVNSVINPIESELSEPPDLEQTKNSDAIIKIYRDKNSMILILDVWKMLSKSDKKHLETKAA